MVMQSLASSMFCKPINKLELMELIDNLNTATLPGADGKPIGAKVA